MTFFPRDSGARPAHMFFDRSAPTERVLDQAASLGEVHFNKRTLIGSPDKLNLFTVEGDILRLDLPIEAHLGGSLSPNGVLILSRGNQLDQVFAAEVSRAALQSSAPACLVM